MLFNSPEFILVFLPAVLALCLALRSRASGRAMIYLLIVASLVFYGWWDPRYVVLIVASIAANYLIGTCLQGMISTNRRGAQLLLVAGISANLLLLGYYKYTNFLLDMVEQVSSVHLGHASIALPLAISFFTFTQIAFLVDCYKSPLTGLTAPGYALFVLFFPHLIAGPIVHHKELTPQFQAPGFARISRERFASGLTLFILGMFKKVCLADTFAEFADPGFDQAQSLSFLEAWATALSYTFQLYFDFSGYCDMAIGLGRMFNVELPANFDAPYRALSIQEFWKRWHITLGRFLRNYVYIPLGGNRGGLASTLRNLFLTFLIGGIWHGAGWTFVAWGAMHGLGLCVHRLWSEFGKPLPRMLAWLLTFLFVVVAWVFFRSPDFGAAWMVLRGMAGMNGFQLNTLIIEHWPMLGYLFEPVGKLSYLADGSLMGIVELLSMSVLAAAIVAFGRPLQHAQSPRLLIWATIVATPFVIHQVFFSSAPSPFLYFRF